MTVFSQQRLKKNLRLSRRFPIPRLAKAELVIVPATYING